MFKYKPQNIGFEYKDHLFMPGHTVKAILRQHNNMTTDEFILNRLTEEFYRINNIGCPKVGQRVKVPIWIEKE